MRGNAILPYLSLGVPAWGRAAGGSSGSSMALLGGWGRCCCEQRPTLDSQEAAPLDGSDRCGQLPPCAHLPACLLPRFYAGARLRVFLCACMDLFPPPLTCCGPCGGRHTLVDVADADQTASAWTAASTQCNSQHPVPARCLPTTTKHVYASLCRHSAAPNAGSRPSGGRPWRRASCSSQP